MKRLLCISLGIVLAGCSASAKYDFDLSCPRDNFKNARGDGETTFACTAPNFFNVLCVANTITYIGSDVHCTTHDEKSVRIQVQD